MARFEGVFLVAIASCLALCRRRHGIAALIAMAGALPVLAYALVSVSAGWLPLPSSVVMKAPLSDLSTAGGIVERLGYGVVGRALDSPHILALIVLAAVILLLLRRRDRTAWSREGLVLLIFIATTLAHLQLARTGSFFRYEAYLVAFGVFAVGIGAPEWWAAQGVRLGHKIGMAILLALCLVPALQRSARAHADAPEAVRCIYEQQRQMATFVREYYQGQSVVANDIGAICYRTDIDLLDFVGLGTREFTVERVRRKLDGEGSFCSAEFIRGEARRRGANLAMVYDNKIGANRPAEWVRVGAWTIRDNVVCGSATVAIYATSDSTKDRLMSQLESFSKRLPDGVIEQGLYTGDGQNGVMP
jgi:hypothetical protein